MFAFVCLTTIFNDTVSCQCGTANECNRICTNRGGWSCIARTENAISEDASKGSATTVSRCTSRRCNRRQRPNRRRGETMQDLIGMLEEDFPGGVAGAVAVGTVSVAAVAPVPLLMFPPAALPQPQLLQPGTFNVAQPATSLAGGGALPTSVLAVGN